MADLLNELIFIIQRLDWLSVIDLFLVTAVFFALLLLLRGTQAVVILRGILILIVLIALLSTFEVLPAFSWMVENSLPALLFAIPVIFAPEIRRALERLGRTSRFLTTERRRGGNQDFITCVIHASARLSDRRHGALIVLQRMESLQEYVDTGVSMGAIVSQELLLQVFFPNTPLHDGAVILREDIMLAAGCVLPLSASGVLVRSADRQMGLRHRAALGISEVSDAVAVVVSEETGAISIAYGGRMIHRLDARRLEGIMRAFFRHLETEGSPWNYLVNFMSRIRLRKPEEK